jgi:TonB-dependent receptor
MNAKTILKLTTCVALASGTWPAIALAQEAPTTATAESAPAPDAAATAPSHHRTRAERRRAKADRLAHKAGERAGPEGNDIVVTGMRGSLATAAKIKRTAKQITDTVVAEDVGKLPDNNVPEALARVTGIQIDRARGEGQSVTIRGMSDIQTTVNGYENSVGEARTTNLADIPAELLKSVTVYKTRTADQIEGGIGGTVDVQLRRPLDLKKGWTIAGSMREVFSSIGNARSPYASLLVANRFDTGIGELGFMVNASYTQNNYNEDFIESESPDVFFGTDQASLPTNLQTKVIAPYAANYGVQRGSVKRPSINVVGQWKPNDHLDFVLEGTYFGARQTQEFDRLHLVLRNGNYDLSNLVLKPDGTSLKSVTVTAPAGGLAGGPESYYNRLHNNNIHTNFETHWHDDKTKINFSVQYDHSKEKEYDILTTYRFQNVNSANLDFDSSNVPGGGPYIDFIGADLSDPSTYSLLNFHDELTQSKSGQFTSQIDLTREISETGLLRSFQTGARFSRRTVNRVYGYRDSFPLVDGASPGITDFLGVDTTTSRPDIPGFDAPSWYHLSGSGLASSMDAIRDFLVTNGTVPNSSWSTPYPSPQVGSGAGGYNSVEKSVAAYAQVNYGFKALFPIDGVIGVRVVNTFGSSNNTTATFGTSGVTYTTNVGRGNYVDVLPSLNAVIHFDRKLQLRLAYTKNVQRPDFLQMSPWLVIDTTNPSIVYSGNPDLKANKEDSYDASLEYNFGRAGSASLAGYLKKPKGYMYYSGISQFVPQLGQQATVYSNRNAGPGTFEGIEVAAQSFFDFLPGIWRNFGLSGNLTYLAKGKIEYPNGTDDNAVGMSKFTYNIALYYDTPKLSARVAWNYRSRFRQNVWDPHPEYSPYTDATSRLDAAINYTPVKFLTLSVEASNLLKNNVRSWWGEQRLIPLGIRLEARTIQAGARFRF